MADIEIIYRLPYCDCDLGDIDTQCFTSCARDRGCKYYLGEQQREEVINGIKTITIPFGDCTRSKFKYIYKGWSGKKYEMEEIKDLYNPHLDCMLVKLGGQLYDCVKVTLNGKCIYNVYEDEAEEGDSK